MEYHALHCLIGDRVMLVVLQIKEWLEMEKHQEEVVILDIQHCYNFDANDHTNLMMKLWKMFPNMLCSWQQDPQNLTIKNLHKVGTRVIVIYPALFCRKYFIDGQWTLFPDQEMTKYFWPRNSCPTPWPDTMNTRTLVSFLTDNLSRRQHQHQCKSPLYVSQGILTPSWRTVVCHPTSNVKNQCSEKCKKPISDWISEVSEDKMPPNIVITDFVSKDIVTKVINLNFSTYCKVKSF